MAVRYVAIGDSFTEGVGDEYPDGTARGWADRVAEGLAAASGQPVKYANLAIRGRLLEPIVAEQIEQAIALDPLPTMLTFNGGGNDMMRPGYDVARLVALTEVALDRCLEAGVRPVLLAGADPSAVLPLGALMRKRGSALTHAVAPLARARGVTYVDLFHDGAFHDSRYWSADRLHLSGVGHARVARRILEALGALEGAAEENLPPREPRTVGTEVRYYRDHVLPWVGRRLRRASSGDGRTGKHADYVEVFPPAQEAG